MCSNSIVNEDGAGEYDVPQCAPGTASAQCVLTLTGRFKVRDSMRACTSRADSFCSPGWNESKKVALLRAGTHCHAPGCLNETLYYEDTGEVI